MRPHNQGVIENLPRLALEDAVTVEQSVVDAIQQETVSVGTTCHDATQKFSTLVLRAGRTILPRLQAQSCDTPLTQQVFAAGLFDATTSSNLAASFGQTKIRLEVRSASPEQYAGDFNTEKEWHQHMPTPWDVMQLNPAEALTISSQSCGVQIAPNELRTTYGRSFVIKELAKFNQDCSALFPQDSKVVCLPRMASIFEDPGFVTPHTPQHKFGAQREYCSAREWQTQLAAIGIDPASLASQSFRPWEATPHPTQSALRERSRGLGKGGKAGKREGKYPRPQGTGPGAGKGLP